jgi:c-di-GMP-binding flagellar brake protein YcgR
MIESNALNGDIRGPALLGILQDLVDSRRIVKMEIPRTGDGWKTVLLGFRKTPPGLLIDGVRGFDRALSRSGAGDVILEFTGTDGVPCHFSVEVTHFQGLGVWTRLPEVIERRQKRAYHRVKAISGTEIAFFVEPDELCRGFVDDFGPGGVSFLGERRTSLSLGDRVTRITFSVPLGEGKVSIDIAAGVVRRLDDRPPKRTFVALEFVDISQKTREQLRRLAFDVERVFLRKVRRD